MRDNQTNVLSRRIGQKASASREVPPVQGWQTSALLLHILAAVLVLPAFTGIAGSGFGRAAGGVIGAGLAAAAARLMRRGLRNEADFQARRIAKAPPPLKVIATICMTAAIFALAWTSDTGLAMSILYAALAGLGCYLMYGLDPRGDKKIDAGLAARAGIDTSAVIEALEEAEGKIRSIEGDARELNDRSLVLRLERITQSGRRILKQIEADPGDIRRARRFLITYLDGTRDVVSQYKAQQRELEQTELGASFGQVLDTVERVFAEQEDVLKRNETLDLEVQIDVLRTQLEREGVN